MTGRDRRQDGGPPPIRSFGRRHGRKLRAGRRDLLDRLLPAVAVPIPDAGETIDPERLFGRPMEAYWLEIGFGGGEHLALQAK